jgi:WD40 repeat protein
MTHQPRRPADATSSLFHYLSACRAERRDPDPSPALRSAFSMTLALLLDRNDDGAPGPPTRVWPAAEAPPTFGPMEFSADGRRLLYAADGGAMVCLDAVFGTQAEPQEGDAERAMVDRSRSPDGRLRTDTHDFVGLVDVESGRLLRRLGWERSSAGACTVNRAFSLDGARIAVSYAYDITVRVFDTDTGELIRSLWASDHEAHLAFSPDGRFLLAGTKSGVRLFQLDSGLSVLPEQRRRTYTVAYHPDGTAVVVDDEGPVLQRIALTALQSTATPPDLETLGKSVLEHELLLVTGRDDVWHDLANLFRCWL